MSDHPMKILMVASEAAPFAKTGGLADVVGSLPVALRSLGHDVRLILPWYRAVESVTGKLPKSTSSLSVPFGGQVLSLGFRTGEKDGVPVYFLEAPDCFDRPELYGEQGVDYPDNAERFGLFSRAALELTRKIDFAPDVIHCHDWQAGLVPVYLQEHLWRDPFFSGTGTLFTIHNLGYQGLFPAKTLKRLGLDSALNTLDALEFHGEISLLKGGIRFADRVNTVSPSYCEEIRTVQAGMGFDGLLRARGERLHGLLNGLDETFWDPSTDAALVARYSGAEPDGKEICKAALQKELGLEIRPETALVAMVTRLDPQKGIDLVLECWDQLLARDIQFVILGSGTPDYERRLAECSAFYPGQASVLLRFDDGLARRIYAGSDLFLMPSRYEPCGLGQLIALRYGSIPLVHATGGLIDTIHDPEVAKDEANGFVFNDFSRGRLLDGLDRALAVYQDSEAWQTLRRRGMRQDLSWQKAAGEYVDLYRLCSKERT